jgi:hypothetical protein
LTDIFALVGCLEVCESDSRGQIRGSSLGKKAREEKYSSTTYAILATLSKCLSRDQPQEIETPLFKNDQDRDRDPHLSAAKALGAWQRRN